MNLEMAQHIIEQEALLLLIKKPSLKFDINNGYKLWLLFRYGNSTIIHRMETMGFVLKINHPKYSIGFYCAGLPEDDVKGHMVRLTKAGEFEAII